MRANKRSFRVLFESIDVFGLWAGLLVLTACQATSPATEDEGRSRNESGAREEIKGGQTTSAFPAVGVFAVDDQPACTGTLIEPRKVLTAAHCLEVFDLSKLTFRIGPHVGSPQYSLSADSMTPHPAYDPETLANDVALVQLASDAPVYPMSLLGSMDGNWVGEELMMVGYGRTSGSGQDSGTKRSVPMKISEIMPTKFRLATSGPNICFGDSGGPALAKLGDNYIVAGVHSAVANDECEQYAIEMRVDAYTTFIETGTDSGGMGGVGGMGGTGGYGAEGGFGNAGGMGGGGGVPSDGCQGETYDGRCDGNLVIWCEAGSVQTQNCANDGKTCGYSTQDNYYGCLAPSDNCQGETYEGRCDGDTLIWCESDQVKSQTCSQCGYDPSNGFYNCL